MVVVGSINDAIESHECTRWRYSPSKSFSFFSRLKTFLLFQSIGHWIPNLIFTQTHLNVQPHYSFCSFAFILYEKLAANHVCLLVMKCFYTPKKEPMKIFHTNEKLHSLPWIWAFICWDSKRHTLCVYAAARSKNHLFHIHFYCRL